MLAQYYKLCGLKQQKIIPPQFWRLEVWIYGVTRGTASRGLRGECTACYFQLLVAVWHLLVWQFSLSTWPRDGSQWFNQTLKKMLPWRYFVDVVNIYDQLTLSKGDYPQQLGVVGRVWGGTPSNQLKGLKGKTKVSLRKNKSCLLTAIISCRPKVFNLPT